MVVFLEYGKSLIAILDCEKGEDESVIQIILNNEVLKFKYSEFVHLNKAFEN
ncbi:hypothetical protein CSEC_2465 [Criblamydia sequanensis CRIB-18]|uniref:Secreted protein n=1 Tax=Candidatus Criblamydia sequanensis CRIB-18 TaxID=1437425 RepID=A0A090D1I9_9BACT|nr:hypothetical protein CSEC_2465 [Criblamydia sequanensis CRIB-18]